MCDFVFCNEGFYCFGNFFDGYCWVNVMLVQKVNVFGVKLFQIGFDGSVDVCGLVVGICVVGICRWVDVKVEFGGDYYLVVNRCQCFVYQFFVGEGIVGFGGVEVGDFMFYCCVDQCNYVLFVCGWVICCVYVYVVQVEGGNFKVLFKGMGFYG